MEVFERQHRQIFKWNCFRLYINLKTYLLNFYNRMLFCNVTVSVVDSEHLKETWEKTISNWAECRPKSVIVPKSSQHNMIIENRNMTYKPYIEIDPKYSIYGWKRTFWMRADAIWYSECSISILKSDEHYLEYKTNDDLDLFGWILIIWRKRSFFIGKFTEVLQNL